MKLKIFPLSTRHILSFKIYQKIRIIFICYKRRQNVNIIFLCSDLKLQSEKNSIVICLIRTLCQSQDAFPRRSQLLLKAAPNMTSQFSCFLEACSEGDMQIVVEALPETHTPLMKGKYFKFQQQVFFYVPKYTSGNSCCWHYQLETIVCV